MRVLLVLFLLVPLFADEEIVVHLSSQESLIPIHIAPLQAKGSGFDKKYIQSLEAVLQFDFDHNGKTGTAQTSQNALKLEPTIQSKTLTVKLINTATGSVKGLENIPLTGNLAQDRQTLHHIHDTVFETLFQAPGIASTRIIYTLRTKNGDASNGWSTEVWEADYDGHNARQVTSQGHLCVTPTFVPARPGERASHLLYVSYQVGQPKIYAASLKERVGRRLTYLKGNQLMPAISPTLDKIAFISDITGNPDLFIQEFSLTEGLLGKPQQIFCAPNAAQGTPTFSPDGKQIAFVSNKDGTPRIYILEIPKPGVSINSLKPRLISKTTRNNTCPAWSPDGTKIAYSASTSGTRQIWVYDTTTGEEFQLTDGYGHKENPAWAPNSLHLLFNSATTQGSELYMIHLNQKKAVKLTSGPGEKRFPSWEPI